MTIPEIVEARVAAMVPNREASEASRLDRQQERDEAWAVEQEAYYLAFCERFRLGVFSQDLKAVETSGTFSDS